MATPNPHVRYQDYKSLPESMDKRYELLDGALFTVPAPTTRHQRISRDIGFLLQDYCNEKAFGEVLFAPVDVVFGTGDEREIAQPDLILVRRERLAIIAEEEVRGAPDLVVEILSPGTETRDRGYKKVLYGRYGVREYWIVNPAQRSIELFTLGESGFEPFSRYPENRPFVSPLLDGFSLEDGEVFP